MINTAWKLKKLAASAIKKHLFHSAISLDIQNAFNLMRWACIMEVLENAKLPVYLHNIIWIYFWNWLVLAQTASGMKRKVMTCSVPQGSVLGPLLWNIAFDDILNKGVPPSVSIICTPMIPEWFRRSMIFSQFNKEVVTIVLPKEVRMILPCLSKAFYTASLVPIMLRTTEGTSTTTQHQC